MGHQQRRLFRAAGFIALLASASFMNAQSNGATAPSSPQDSTAQPGTVIRSNTRLVIVDVVVTDNRNQPVTDLNINEFTVLENGKKQQINALSFQGGPDHGAAEPVRTFHTKNPAPNTFSNVPEFPSDTSLNVILLDGLNTTTQHQNEVREQMVKLLEKLPAGHPVAVYFLGSKLMLLQDFTTDTSALRAALEQFKANKSALLEKASGTPNESYLPSPIMQAGVPWMMAQISAFISQNVAVQNDLRVNYTLDALKSLSRTLAGYKGRKNLIWVSEAFPLTSQRGGFRDYGPAVTQAEEALTNAEIAVYPVDARGVAGSDFFRAGAQTTDDMGRPYQNPRTVTMEMQKTSDETMAAHSAMNDVAEQTGGQAFYNTNAFDKVVLRSMDDGSHYYTLGYYPDDKNWDGKFRKIEVKVDRPGIKLRHRNGYYATDPVGYAKRDASQRAAEFGQALNLDFPVSTAIMFDAGVAAPSAENGNKVTITYHIDAHPIAFNKADDGLQHATLDCAAEIYTEKGEALKTEAISVGVAVKPELFRQVMQNYLPCRQSFQLAPGNYFLRLGIRDGSTGLIGTANAKLTVAGQSKN